MEKPIKNFANCFMIALYNSIIFSAHRGAGKVFLIYEKSKFRLIPIVLGNINKNMQDLITKSTVENLNHC